MQQHMHYEIELAGTAATLYIAGRLGAEDVVRSPRPAARFQRTSARCGSTSVHSAPSPPTR